MTAKGGSGGALEPGPAGGTSPMMPSGGTQATGGGGAENPSGGGGSGGTAGADTPSGGGGSPAGGAAGMNGGGGAGGGTSVTDLTIVPDPSWACGMPDGILPAKGELVFEATLELGEVHDFGVTQYGQRRLFDVEGGTLTGDDIEATFLTGGLDLELTLSNGATELEQLDMLRADDGTLIYMRSCGVAPAGDPVVRIVPDFEVANSSSLAWLNTGKFVGTRVVNTAANTIELTVYDVSEAPAAAATLRLEDPPDAVDQPWDCSTDTGSRGASVFTETVNIGGSLSVGASKRGTRNVIPITGGSVSGRVEGVVLPGGADYQLLGGSAVLDARYTVASDDDEYILIRNCGPFGAMVPLFETRADGPYAFLNTGRFLSSDPGSAAGGVSITFYERN